MLGILFLTKLTVQQYNSLVSQVCTNDVSWNYLYMILSDQLIGIEHSLLASHMFWGSGDAGRLEGRAGTFSVGVFQNQL